MYAGIVRRWYESVLYGPWRRHLMRSGMVTAILLTALVIGLGVVYQQHMRGNFHKLKAEIAPEHSEAHVPRPGGQEPLVLTRAQLSAGSTPEFLSVTMLPGRGMNILQISAYLPTKGEVNLLASASVEDAERAMTGVDTDVNGGASLAMGGAFEAPWSSRIWGSASQGRVTTAWRGHTIVVPEIGAGSVATGGLLLMQQSTSQDTSAMPDGGQAKATFDAGDFGARWPSKTTVNVTVLLSSKSIELTLVARNIGDFVEPIGIGWHPRFAILGERDQMRLQLPAQMRAEVRDRQAGLPSGILLPVAGTPYDFMAHGGEKLGFLSLDDSFVHLRQDVLENGPVAILSDPSNSYGLRLRALSPAIKAFHVIAPAGANFVSIEPQYNYDDPFGREWPKDTDTGMVVLQPGQSTQWKIRLELIPLGDDSTSH